MGHEVGLIVFEKQAKMCEPGLGLETPWLKISSKFVVVFMLNRIVNIFIKQWGLF